jgi:phosphoserine phosphatase
MGGDGGERHGLLAAMHTIQPIRYFPNADRLHDRKGWVQSQRTQGLDLLDSASVEHCCKAPGDPVAQDVAIRVEHHALYRPGTQRTEWLLVLKARQGPPRGPLDGQGPYHPLRISDLEARGRLRVLGPQQRHALWLVQNLNLLLNLKSQRLRNLGHIGESVCQRIEVKSCAADKNNLAQRIELRQRGFNCAQPFTGRKASRRWGRAVEPMLCNSLVLRTGTRRHYAQSVVNLHGISVDDDAVAALRPRKRQRRLAAGSRTRYQHCAPLACHQTLPKVTATMPVLSLIANPADPELDAALAQAIVAQTGGELNWLNHGVACDIHEPTAPQALDLARDIIGSKRVDANLVPTDGRRKQLLVADMDSTMIEQECIDELAAALGLKAQVAEITDKAMRGELDFAEALDTRVALLKGLERSQIEEIRRGAITLAPGGRALVQTMKAYGAFTSLVSGGFTFFADYFARRIGFDEAIANVLEFDGERLTGTVTKPIVDKNTKRTRLLDLAHERGLNQIQTLAVGDGANDLDMIGVAGFGVALHAKPAVAAAAGLRIDHGDLTALLYLQGYAEDDFVR